MESVIKKYTGVPFRYGLDCCQFVGECVESVTGRNPMDGFKYANEDEAMAIINSHGSLENAINDTLGQPYDGFSDGDVCLVEMWNGEQLAGVAWKGRVIVRTKRDLMDLPSRSAKKVWQCQV